MLERLTDPKFQYVSKASPDAMLALAEIMEGGRRPRVAEIGVGIGATTLAMAERMGGHGHLYLFDFEQSVSELQDDLRKLGFENVAAFGNSPKTFDSYAWSLAKLRLASLKLGEPLLFDFVYLDGAHAFHHDAPATAVVKEMINVNGLLLMDDYAWTFNKSPTMNPKANPKVAGHYTKEQLEMPHVKLVCELLLDTDDRFRRDTLSDRISGGRALYRRIR